MIKTIFAIIGGIIVFLGLMVWILIIYHNIKDWIEERELRKDYKSKLIVYWEKDNDEPRIGVISRDGIYIHEFSDYLKNGSEADKFFPNHRAPLRRFTIEKYKGIYE